MGQHLSVGQHLSMVRDYISSTLYNQNVVNNGKQRRKRHYDRKISKRNLSDNQLQQITYDVLDLIFDWFPELHERTYFLPPVHMNKLQYGASRIRELRQDVQEIQPTAESDWRDDEVMQRMLCCLRALTQHRNEAMVVLLQMQHDNYLHKPCYAAAAARYPRPCDLPTNLRRGDFDILFVHSLYGLVVAEIKSVGWRPVAAGEQDDATVKKKVSQAVEQLNKANTVLGHLVSDLQPSPRITKTLVLPNATSQRLLTLLEQDLDLAKDFCSCFNVSDIPSAVQLCLCSDQMTSVQSPADVTDAILDKLNKWWEGLVMNIHQGCIAEVYELLVARFCGPASTVRVHCVKPPRLLEFRTLGHAVQEVGKRMVQFVLFPEQLAMLQEEEDCVFLTGPPGTGKTLLLILIALKWSRNGHEVHVVSTESFSEAATQLMYFQITETLAGSETDAAARSRVKLHSNGNSTKNTQQLLSDLISASRTPMSNEGQLFADSASQGGQLYIIADEVDSTFRGMFAELRNNVSDLHVWAGSYSHGHRPEGMEERRLSVCLRSTPIVMRRMGTAVSFANGNVYRFEDKRNEYLSPTEGTPELYLSHLDHTEGRAMDCVQCGQDIADCLHNQLGVGQRQKYTTAVKTPDALEYRDVIIIPDWYQNIADLTDEDDSSGQTRRASGIVRGLRSRGVPAYVVKSQDVNKIQDLARASRDEVAVAAWGVSNGLERKVVVSVGQGKEMSTGVSGVLHGASRCVSQLIYVTCPE